jgi:hypothetical protein
MGKLMVVNATTSIFVILREQITNPEHCTIACLLLPEFAQHL